MVLIYLILQKKVEIVFYNFDTILIPYFCLHFMQYSLVVYLESNKT